MQKPITLSTPIFHPAVFHQNSQQRNPEKWGEYFLQIIDSSEVLEGRQKNWGRVRDVWQPPWIIEGEGGTVAGGELGSTCEHTHVNLLLLHLIPQIIALQETIAPTGCICYWKLLCNCSLPCTKTQLDFYYFIRNELILAKIPRSVNQTFCTGGSAMQQKWFFVLAPRKASSPLTRLEKCPRLPSCPPLSSSLQTAQAVLRNFTLDLSVNTLGLPCPDLTATNLTLHSSFI